MEAVRRWQRLRSQVVAGLLLVWIIGLLAILVLPNPNRPLKLRLIDNLQPGVLLQDPVEDGRGGLCLQQQDGQVLHISPEGRQDWSFAASTNFRLQSVQPGADFLVLSGRFGDAYAVNDDGSERWRFEPVHHEMQIELRKRRSGEARFFTMATGLVYGLDERGTLAWVRHIPSATAVAQDRPWMAIDEEGRLFTRSNSGIIRISPQGELLLIRSDKVWNTRSLDSDDSGRILENYGMIQITRGDGGPPQGGLGQWDTGFGGGIRNAWLTSEGFALVRENAYIRFDHNGEELRSSESDWNLLQAAALGDEHLLLRVGEGIFPDIQQFPTRLQAQFRGSPINGSSQLTGNTPLTGLNVSPPTTEPPHSHGRSRLELETAELTVEVDLPGWFSRTDMRIHGFGDDKLLVLDDSGRARVCQLVGNL